jgi:hypothetical protein
MGPLKGVMWGKYHRNVEQFRPTISPERFQVNRGIQQKNKA